MVLLSNYVTKDDDDVRMAFFLLCFEKFQKIEDFYRRFLSKIKCLIEENKRAIQ
jgi:hypothetical protein